MDDKPILDCIVVATSTDSPPTMAPENKPSTTAGHAAGKVHAPAREGPEQNQRANKSSSSSTAAIPESRHIQGKNTAASSAAGKRLSPAARAASGSKRSPAFPSTCPPAKQSPSSSTVHERPPKRNHDDAFPPNSNRDLGKQPVRYSQDSSKDAKNLGQTESRHTLARLEVISISSDNDDEADSDDKPLAVIRKRTTTSITPNPSGSQQKKPAPAKIRSRTSSSTPNTQTRTSTTPGSHAQSWPSTAQKSQQTGHVYLTRSEDRADEGMTKNSRIIQGSQLLGGTISGRGLSKLSDVADLNEAQSTTGSRSKESAAAATPHFDNEKKELRAKIEQKETENQTLAKQLRESRALAWTTNQSKLADEREISTLRQELGARNQQIDALVSEKDSLNESITKLRDEVSQEKEDANQSLITHQHQEAKLQKLLDDQMTKNMHLEVALRDLQKQESSKIGGAKITKLEASNRELREKTTQMEGTISRMGEDILFVEGQRDIMIAETDETKAERDRLQSRLLQLELQLQQQSDQHALSDDSRKSEIEELQKQVSNLHEEVKWYKGNRERIRKDWEERVAMETKWRENLQAVINNHRMTAEEMRRAALAAQQHSPQGQLAQGQGTRG